MAEDTFLRVNQRIEIMVREGDRFEQYPSRIEALERDRFIVAAPMWHGVPLRLPLGTSVEVALMTPTALYEFATLVVGAAERPLPTLTLIYPNVVNRIQRRQFVRVEDALPVRVESPTRLEAITINVSGGGVLLNLKPPQGEAPSIGEEWSLELYLPDRPEPLHSVGRVLRAQRVPGSDRLQVALEFVQIDEETRKAIIQHVFQRQLQQRPSP
ncbi:MAG: flagellar brake domain-containing protein [Abditibacteriales bacterium]|nr:flagellar brake domain-containing protein [Abditibacteriales bacterium]MDW8365143.1 flagellar brake domain-containing protein [Abditibacteriales bacterium]